MQNRHYTEYIFLLLIVSAAFLLFFYNLDNQYLWQDEAQTALVSKTILRHGVPLGYDGKNFFSQQTKAEYGKNYIWRWHTWLPFYVLAGFFKLFGVNTFVARLPFAIFGVGSVFLTYFFSKILWQNKKIAVVAAFLLLINVPFLLLSRQCRYYSMSAFFSLCSLYAYVGLLDKRKYSYVIFIVSSVLLFHTHYIYCATLLVTVFFHALLFYRHRLKTVFLLACIVVLINIPWIFWLMHIRHETFHLVNLLSFVRFIEFTGKYLSLVAQHLLPPYLLLLVPLVVIVTKIKTGRFFLSNKTFLERLSLLLLFVFFNLTALIFTSPLPFFRYLAPLIPVITIIIALLVVTATRIHPIVAAAVIVLLIFTGSLREFLYEITHDYDGPVEGIARYLNEHGDESDVVAITYGDLPLKFYTQMRIVGGLTGEDLSLAKQADWVILRKYIIWKQDAKVWKYLIQNLPLLEHYERIEIDYPDIAFENRESPAEHHFRTVVDEDKVVIYRKFK